MRHSAVCTPSAHPHFGCAPLNSGLPILIAQARTSSIPTLSSILSGGGSRAFSPAREMRGFPKNPLLVLGVQRPQSKDLLFCVLLGTDSPLDRIHHPRLLRFLFHLLFLNV